MRDAVIVATPGNAYEGKDLKEIDRAYRSLNDAFYQQFTFRYPNVYLDNDIELSSGLKGDQEMMLRVLLWEPVSRVGSTEHQLLLSFYQLQPRTVYEGSLPDAEIVHFEGHPLAIRLAQQHIAHFYRSQQWDVTTPSLHAEISRIQRGPLQLLNLGTLLEPLQEKQKYDAQTFAFRKHSNL